MDPERARRLVALSAIACALFAGCDRAAEPAPRPRPATSAVDDARAAPEAAGVGYVERILGGASAEEPLPLIVAVHGLGDRPESFASVYAALPVKARLIAPRGEPWQGGFSWFSAGSLDDPPRLAEGTARAADRLAQMIEVLLRTRPSRGRAIVTGFSQGGMLSFTLAVRHPALVAAAFPVSGLIAPELVPTSWPMAAASPPIRAFHGDADGRVSVARARDSVAALTAIGLDAGLREYAGVGHTISPAMRADLLRAIAEAARSLR